MGNRRSGEALLGRFAGAKLMIILSAQKSKATRGKQAKLGGSLGKIC